MRAAVQDHPYLTVLVLAAAGAAALVLAVVLIAVPVLTRVGAALDGAPGAAVHAYENYSNGIGQQFYEACLAARGPDCAQWQQQGARP